MMKFLKIKPSKSPRPSLGQGLLETVFYIGLFAALSLVVVGAIVSVSSVYARASAKKQILLEGDAVLDRIVREIRLASSVDETSSSFGANPSYVSLISSLSFTDPTPVIKRFYVENSRIMFSDGINPASPFTSSKVSVSTFVLYHATSAFSGVIKAEVVLNSGHGKASSSLIFFASAVLRGEYR